MLARSSQPSASSALARCSSAPARWCRRCRRRPRGTRPGRRPGGCGSGRRRRGAAREAQKRAVSSSISTPMHAMNSSSPVAFQYSHTRPGHVGRDVVLHEAGEDGHHLAVGAEAVRRRGLDRPCRPTPTGTARRGGPCGAPSARAPVEVAVAVGQQRARRLGLRVDEERQTKISVSQNTCRKYDMPPRPRAPTETVSLVGCAGADHVVDGEAQRRAASSASPSMTTSASRQRCVPRRAVAPQELVEAELLAPAPAARSRESAERHPGARRDERRQAVDGGRLARLEAPADHVARLLEVARRRASRAPGAVVTASTWPPPLRPLRARHEARRRRAPRTSVSLGRPAGVRDADGALPDERAGEVLGRGLGAHGHELPVGQRGEARRAHAHRAAATRSRCRQ